MKKALLLTAALIAVLSTVAFAADYYPMGMADNSTLYPAIGGVGQILTIYPGDKASAGANWALFFKPVVDPNTGVQATDPFDGQPAYARNWLYYVPNANGTSGVRQVPVLIQSVTLEKIIPIRKTADTGNPWLPGLGKNTRVLLDGTSIVTQTEYPGKVSDLIMGEWPLLYEVDGVEYRLTVRYSTDIRVADTVGGVAGKIHVAVYHWYVNSHVVTMSGGLIVSLDSLNARIAAFRQLPFGTNEVVAVTFNAKKGINNFIGGYGVAGTLNWVPGFIYWANARNRSAAVNQLTNAEAYIDTVSLRDGWYHNALYASNNETPCPIPGEGEAIVDNSTCPAASILINDVWAVMSNTGVKTLIEK
jgi:hypothetical protein